MNHRNEEVQEDETDVTGGFSMETREWRWMMVSHGLLSERSESKRASGSAERGGDVECD